MKERLNELMVQEAITDRPLPPYPTHHLPGSRDKQNIMRDRYASGYHIHHPCDATLGEDELDESRMIEFANMLEVLRAMKGLRRWR